MSGKSHLPVLRYKHFYTSKNKGGKKGLDKHNKVYSTLENCNHLKASIEKRKRMMLELVFNEMQFSTHFVVPGQIYVIIIM